MQFEETDPQLPAVPKNFLSSSGYVPLPFIRAGGIASLKGGVMRSHLLSGSSYFANPPLPPVITLPHGLWIELKIVEFRGKGILMPEFSKDSWTSLLDDTSIEQRALWVNLPLPPGHDWWWPYGSFPFSSGFSPLYGCRYRQSLYILGFCGCLHRFESRLKAVGVYKEIWPSLH